MVVLVVVVLAATVVLVVVLVVILPVVPIVLVVLVLVVVLVFVLAVLVVLVYHLPLVLHAGAQCSTPTRVSERLRARSALRVYAIRGAPLRFYGITHVVSFFFAVPRMHFFCVACRCVRLTHVFSCGRADTDDYVRVPCTLSLILTLSARLV